MKEHLYEDRPQSDNGKFKDSYLIKDAEFQKQENLDPNSKKGAGYKYLYDQVHISGPAK